MFISQLKLKDRDQYGFHLMSFKCPLENLDWIMFLKIKILLDLKHNCTINLFEIWLTWHDDKLLGDAELSSLYPETSSVRLPRTIPLVLHNTTGKHDSLESCSTSKCEFYSFQDWKNN